MEKNILIVDDEPSIIKVLDLFLKKEGFRYLWKGNLTNCLRAFPQFGISYAVYAFSKNNLFYFLENHHFGALALPDSEWSMLLRISFQKILVFFLQK